MPNAIISRAITYTFGPGQKEGFDNVSVFVQTESVHPITKAVEQVGVSISVALPAAGWTDDDVLKAVQEALPDFAVAWFEPAPVE